MPLTSKRLDRIAGSATTAVRMTAARMAAQGRDVLRTSSGEPDFDTPSNIRDAAIRAIQAGDTKYTDVAGTSALREAAAGYFRHEHGLEYKPEEILVSTGGKQVIFNALLATINPGDEAIIPAPCWVSYPEIVSLAEGKPVILLAGQEQGFRITAAQLDAAITPRTKWLILNNPSNPTGAVYDAEALRPLAEVLLRHPQIHVFTDDIYEKIVYDLKPATMAAVEPRLKDRTVTMNGCSKAWAMTGWRIGFAGAPLQLVKAMDKLQSQSTSNTSTISQAAAVEALTGPQESVEVMRKAYLRRRDMVVALLNDAKGVDCLTPQGAFYVFPSIFACLGKTSPGGRKIETDQDFVVALLEEEGVATVQGTAFLAPGHFRLSYAAADEVLREACLRIQRFCAALT
jgi:aspartate aminotransferase